MAFSLLLIAFTIIEIFIIAMLFRLNFSNADAWLFCSTAFGWMILMLRAFLKVIAFIFAMFELTYRIAFTATLAICWDVSWAWRQLSVPLYNLGAMALARARNSANRTN